MLVLIIYVCLNLRFVILYICKSVEKKFCATSCSMGTRDEESQPIINQTDGIASDKSAADRLALEEAQANDEGTPWFGFFYFGILGLLCFNVYLQVSSYLTKSYNPRFIEWANVLYGLSNNVGQLIAIFTGSRFSFFNRIWISSLGLALVVVGLPVFAQTNLSIRTYLGYLFMFGLGLCNAIMQSAGFGLAGSVSTRAINWYSIGQAVSGLLGMPFIVLTKWILGLFANGNTQKYTPDDVSAIAALVLSALLTLSMIPYYYFGLSRNAVVAKTLASIEKPAVPGSSARYVESIVAVLPIAVSVWFVMFLTFLVFPNQIFKWTPSFSGYSSGLFINLMIFCFQLFDVVGRYLALAGLTMTPLMVLTIPPWRIVLVVAMYVCSTETWIFQYDITRFVLMALFAASNGLFISWCMILGPQQGKRENSDIASYTMSFALVNGILCGSLVGTAISPFFDSASKAAKPMEFEMQHLVSVVHEIVDGVIGTTIAP